MNIGIELITTNLGISFESTILIIVFLGSIILCAKDFKLGLVLGFLINALVFMWFYHADYNYVPMLILTLLSFVLMSFSLYAVDKNADTGGFI